MERYWVWRTLGAFLICNGYTRQTGLVVLACYIPNGTAVVIMHQSGVDGQLVVAPNETGLACS